MKTLSFLLLAFFFLSQSGNAQNKDSKILSLENVNVLVLETYDQTSIEHSNKDQIKISTYLFPKGKSWGFKSPSNRPKFEIVYKISNDTAFLLTPKPHSPKTIGISTYTEHIETDIEIPTDITVIIRLADQLMINDPFKNIQVLQAKNIAYSNLHKAQIARMICKAENKLSVNGISRSLEYEIEGPGKNRIRLNSKIIQINTVE